MTPLYPLMFEPRFKERVWGGRTLQSLYGKHLPAAVPIGESWEVADRPGDESGPDLQLGGAADDVAFHLALIRWFATIKSYPGKAAAR